MLEPIFNKVAALKACNCTEMRLQHKCFPGKFTKFLRTPFLTEHLRQLLLKTISFFHFEVFIQFISNPFQPNVVFHIETGHLIYIANQMTSFYMKCNTGLKWVNAFQYSLKKRLRHKCFPVKYVKQSFLQNTYERRFVHINNTHLSQQYFLQFSGKFF